MRSPESRAGHRAGRTFEEELSLRYLSPGAFTILSAEDHGLPPDPPTAPLPYRLAPTNVRHKNQSFSILAEFNPPLEASRSPSPTSGRVSPFRGRGFNPVGSRHASPPAGSPPPPPDDVRYASGEKLNRNRSQIPQLQRRDSMGQSVDESDDQQETRSPKFRRKQGAGGSTRLNANMSQSLTNVNGGGGAGLEKQGLQRGGGRPPISPRKFPGIHGKGAAAAFSRLSPIIGSSPEPCPPEPRYPSSSTASSKIPRSRSQPHSRRQSPNRAHSPESKRHNSRAGQRSQGGSTFRVAGSKNASRDPSPGTSPTSPTRIPVRSNSYKNVQAKINTGSVNRTPRPPKQEEKDKPKERITRKESYRNRSLHRNSNNNSSNKTFNRNSNNNNSSGAGSNKNINKISEEKSDDSNGNKSSTRGLEKKPSATNLSEKTAKTRTDNNSSSKDSNGNSSSNASEKNVTNSNNSNKPTIQQVQPAPVRKVESVPRLADMMPSAETVVTTTTTAVTKPLKIEAKLDTAKTDDAATTKPPKETRMYMDESRVLSATSVSSAINRMNDTVLDSQTLMKDHNLTKLSPAASAIISMSNSEAATMGNAVPAVENVKTKLANDVATVETTVKNNIGKLISPDDTFGARVSHVSVNEGVKEPRTVVAVVAEKPMNADLQSGNVRLPNGISSERPGLPPPQPPVNNANNQQLVGDNPTDAAKTNCCNKYFKCCLPKPKDTSTARHPAADTEGDKPKRDWLSCCRKGGNKSEHDMEEAIVSTATTATTTATAGAASATKNKWYERLKCWKRKGNKVGDGSTMTSCCPLGKRKQSWADRRDSILSDMPASGSFCKRFWRKIFCLDSQCCKKKAPVIPQDSVSRRTSLISKKKSLTPTVLPQDDPKDKIDASLVEHTSTMKGAIPVLPVGLAWFCLVMNCIAPGTGTVFSGMFCLCMGKPRFSQKDGAKPRIGSFLINLIIGCGQAFTVLFCLVGWGWSIWWGVIMIKTARKHRKIKLIEAAEEEHQRAVATAAAAPAATGGKQPGQPAATTHRNNQRDVERGS